MVHISIFYGVATPKYANIVRNVDDSRQPMKKFMLSSLIFFRSRRDAKRHSREAVSAIWSHKGGKERGFVVQFNRVESFRDIYNGEHLSILQFSARTRIGKNKHAVNRAIILFYLLKTRTICAIFLYNWTQSIDGFSLLLVGYVRKGNDAKNPAILSFFFVTERTQLNAAHA